MSAPHDERHAIRTYGLVAAALFVLLAATVGVSVLPLHAFGLVVALLIAGAKAALVAVYFMHLDRSSGLMRVFAGAGLFWLLILLGLTLSDYITRA